MYSAAAPGDGACPPNTVYVGRPSRWGNPLSIAAALDMGYANTRTGAHAVCVQAFQDWLTHGKDSELRFPSGADRHDDMTRHLYELRGKWLACWCRLDQLCHADVLLAAENRADVSVATGGPE